MKELHQKLAVIFGAFAGIELVWNVFTPNNPHHDLNVTEHACLLVLFTLTYFTPKRPAEALQVLALIVVAFIPMGMEDSAFFGAVVAVIALILIYAYGGYQSRPWWKYLTTNVALFWICSVSMSHFATPSWEVYGRTATWVLFVNVFCIILWIIVQHRERMGAFARELIEQNRKLLVEIKLLVDKVATLTKRVRELEKEIRRLKGGADAVTTGKDRRP